MTTTEDTATHLNTVARYVSSNHPLADCLGCAAAALSALNTACATGSRGASVSRDHRDPTTGRIVVDHAATYTGPLVDSYTDAARTERRRIVLAVEAALSVLATRSALPIDYAGRNPELTVK